MRYYPPDTDQLRALRSRSVYIHGRRLLHLLLGSGNGLGSAGPRRASTPTAPLGGGTALTAAKEHAAHHVEQRIAALPGDLDAEPDLADLQEGVAPQALDVLEVCRVVFGELLEQARVALLRGQHDQRQEIQQRDRREDAQAEARLGRFDRLRHGQQVRVLARQLRGEGAQGRVGRGEVADDQVGEHGAGGVERC